MLQLTFPNGKILIKMSSSESDSDTDTCSVDKFQVMKLIKLFEKIIQQALCEKKYKIKRHYHLGDCRHANLLHISRLQWKTLGY